MKKILLVTALLVASTFAATADTIPCKTNFDALANSYPRDAAADRIYSQVYTRIAELESLYPTPKDLGGDQKKLYNAELKNCEAAVELLKTALDNAALRQSLDSLTQKQISSQKELSSIQSQLIAIWAGKANEANYLANSLSDEKARAERLAKEQAEKDSLEKARLAEELANQSKALSEKDKALAEKDSLLAKQKREADERLQKMQSKNISVYRDARGTILALSDILFETGKADLTQELKVNLAEVAAILKTLLADSKVIVEGHTDNVGKADANKKLSQQRADGVKNYLIERGVTKKNLTSVGYGLTKPIADNSTEAGRAKNRRVELVIQDK
ncbi:cell envelope biogenesis protein OmpA [Fibrobacterales bacterium]|nr:cell envelope biogenesis protein OmpA [Fibrobacterales bacterium]